MNNRWNRFSFRPCNVDQENIPGGLAQLGERLAGSQKVRGSSPLSSTKANLRFVASWPFSMDLRQFRCNPSIFQVK